MTERPNDVRNFIHKRFFGAAKRFVSSGGNPLAAVGGFIEGGRPRLSAGGRDASMAKFQQRDIAPVRQTARRPAPRTLTARPSAASAAEKELGREVKFEGPILSAQATNGTRAPCDFPRVRDSAGRCRTPTSGEFGGEQFGVGAAVMGRYGTAQEPGSMIVDRAICGRGMQLGDDGLCYNKAQISNKQRMWPKGRKPLLTGGEMRAISIAATAGRRLETATKRLQRLGLMKKAAARRAIAQHQHAKPLPAVSIT